MEAYTQPFPGESDLTFEYFTAYRDMGPTRTLRALEKIEIAGRTRGLRQIGKWSSEFEWQTRVEAFDVNVARAASIKTVENRANALQAFITRDMGLALIIQDAFIKWCQNLESKTPDDYSEWVNLYSDIREWIFNHTDLSDKESTSGTTASELIEALTQQTGGLVALPPADENGKEKEKETQTA